MFTELQNEQKKGCGRMIDIAHAKQEFEKYLDEYDREDEQIYLKIVLTFFVAEVRVFFAFPVWLLHGSFLLS